MQTIVFVDSGIGGIPYFLHALEHIPDVQGLYIADTAFFPYGTREPGVLKAHVHKLLEAVQGYCSPKVYVLACNTASVVALHALRGSFRQTFMGTVPAVKPAAKLSKKKNIGIMATEHTIQDSYLSRLLAEHAPGHAVTMLSATELIWNIERQFFEPDLQGIERIANRFLDAGCDTVVLGCTHFTHVEKQLSEFWKRRICLVDSREGITRQLYRHLHAAQAVPELCRDSNADIFHRSSFFITSPERDAYYENIARHFGLNFSGILEWRGNETEAKA